LNRVASATFVAVERASPARRTRFSNSLANRSLLEPIALREGCAGFLFLQKLARIRA
jgi:hypothetical protein